MQAPPGRAPLLRAPVPCLLLCVMAYWAWADAGPVGEHFVRTTRSPAFVAGNVESGQVILAPGPPSRVRFALDVTWAPAPNDGALTHVGRATGEVAVHRQRAVFVDAETDCVLVFHVQPYQVVVTQRTPCLFGANVDASGTYVQQGRPGARARR